MPMKHVDFSFLNVMILLLFTGQLAFVLFLKHQALQSMEQAIDRTKATKTWNLFFLIIFLFLLGVSFLGMNNFFSVPSYPPRFPVIIIPTSIFMFYLLSMKVTKELSFLKSFPAELLVAVQFFRFLLEFIILGLYRQEMVPKEITYLGRSFDILTGILSLLVGYLLFKKVQYAKIMGILFNLFGLASLVNIIYIAANSFPSPFRIFATNHLPSFFPGILIPAFIAPFAICIHILSLKQLLFQIRLGKKTPLYAAF